MTEAPIYLVDSTVLIDATLRREPARTWLDGVIRSAATVAISVVSVAEVMAGTLPPDREWTRRFLGSLEVWPVSEEIAFDAGVMRYERSRQGFALHAPDALIAAAARAAAAVVVTANVKDFQGLGIPLLRVGA